jgi:hypothetical protein
MYGQPVSTLPSQEWMMQQQQQVQQLRAQTQMPNQNGQVYPEQTNSEHGNEQGYSNSQNFGNNSPNSQYENVGTTTAPRPGAQTLPVNPLATYENQLRQLDSQYNNTLQQLDRNPSAAVPRTQY